MQVCCCITERLQPDIIRKLTEFWSCKWGQPSALFGSILGLTPLGLWVSEQSTVKAAQNVAMDHITHAWTHKRWWSISLLFVQVAILESSGLFKVSDSLNSSWWNLCSDWLEWWQVMCHCFWAECTHIYISSHWRCVSHINDCGTGTGLHTNIRTDTHMHTRTHACMHACTHACTCARAHTHTHIHTHKPLLTEWFRNMARKNASLTPNAGKIKNFYTLAER